MLLGCRSSFWLATIVTVAGQVTAHCSELCVKVEDENRDALQNAWINVRDLSTAKTYTETSGPTGRACLAVSEGTYSVEAGRLGYLTVRQYPIRVMLPRSSHVVLRLPIGDVIEGEILKDALLTGSIRIEKELAQGARLCVLDPQTRRIVSCTRTNVFGEYALSVPPGTYRVEATTAQGASFSSTIDAEKPGVYHDRIVFPDAVKN